MTKEYDTCEKSVERTQKRYDTKESSYNNLSLIIMKQVQGKFGSQTIRSVFGLKHRSSMNRYISNPEILHFSKMDRLFDYGMINEDDRFVLTMNKIEHLKDQPIQSVK